MRFFRCWLRLEARRDNDNYLVAFCQLVMSTSVFFVLQ